MVKLYVDDILAGKMVIEAVPKLWQKKVRAALDELEEKEDEIPEDLDTKE